MAGSFNNWNAETHPLKQTGSVWETSLKVPAGYYYYKLVVNGQWITDPANSWSINDGGQGRNSILKAGHPPVPKRKFNPDPLPAASIPRPVFDDRPDWIHLYHEAWRMAWNHVQKGTDRNGFAETYMDEAFNELIYQWDTSFMTAFAVYARPAFPAMQSLDNFYARQRQDGYIQRVYWESDGSLATLPTMEEPMVNPPLFAWMEWRYAVLSGDTTRLVRVYPVLKNYFQWLEQNLRHPDGKGLYYQTDLGSGMDNIPRPGVGLGGWIDQSAQMVLFARMMQKLAVLAGFPDERAGWSQKVSRDSTLIQDRCWNEKTGWFHDVRPDGSQSPVLHIGAVWTWLAGIPTGDQTRRMAAMLNDPTTFNRPHRVPSLAASDPLYDPLGHYWRGGVWAPTTYATVQGLQTAGERTLAREVAVSHLTALSKVYANPGITDSAITWEDRFQDGYRTLWECYSPDSLQPGTRWDRTFRGRQDFVGWTGLGPIAMLIETILGISVNSLHSEIVWELNGKGRQGIENLAFRHSKVSLIAVPASDHWKISIESKEAFLLKVVVGEKTTEIRILPGRTEQQIRITSQ